MTGTRDETKWAPLTTEFWAMLVLIAAVLITAAVYDSLNDVRAWTLVTIVGAGIHPRPRVREDGHRPAPWRGGRRSS